MRHWKKKPWVDSEVRNWDYIADHLAPDASSADAGKVLTVGETGKPEWGEGGGSGGGVQVIKLTDNNFLKFNNEYLENLYVWNGETVIDITSTFANYVEFWVVDSPVDVSMPVFASNNVINNEHLFSWFTHTDILQFNPPPTIEAGDYVCIAETTNAVMLNNDSYTAIVFIGQPSLASYRMEF